ncbi:MAG: TonB-dependent receptor [Pedobacter sp.]|nr:MAG: TonB-dependent receptor [Pedobacter sp.]
MKRFLLIILLAFSMVKVNAQIPGFPQAAKSTIAGRITMVVLDSVTNEPMEYVNIGISKFKDNKPVNGGVTDSKGKVVLQNIAPDEYKVAIGFLGYETKVIKITTTPEKPDLNLGQIFLQPTKSTLNEVVIEGQKAVIENKIDRMVYNAEADGTNAGGDATDVLRKVPMLAVDMNGNIQLRGSAVRVLINGKPSGTMANSVGDALKMIPAEQIKSVEVITSPSAKYDAEGSGGIINIITKKSNAQGVSGSVNTSVGIRQNNGAFNLTAKTGRLSMNTALGTSLAYPQSTRISLINKTNTSEVSQNGYSEWKRNLYNGSLGLDYDFNSYNNISTNVKYNRFYNGGDGAMDLIINNVPASSYNLTDQATNNVDWNVDYRKTSKKVGREFSIAAQLTEGRNTNEFENRMNLGSPMPMITASNNVGKNREYTLQADIIEPIKPGMTFELGVKGIARNILSAYSANSAQDFDYVQNVAAAYSTISFNVSKKIQFKGGLRAEYTDIDLNNNFKNDYFNLFPNVILSHTITPMSSFKVSYNRRVQRPSLAYLNPFRNESNQFAVSQGNPYLDPELSDNLELGYSTFIKGTIINASVFYRNINHVIENTNIVDNIDPNKVLTTFTNVGTSQSFGTNLFVSYNPLPKWTLMTNLGLNTYQVKNSLTDVNTDTYLNYNAFLRSATTFKKGISLELFGVVSSPRYTFQGKTDAMYFYGGSIKKELFKKKGSVGLNVINPLSRDLAINVRTESANTYQAQEIRYPIRSVGVNFSYSFGKLKFTEKKRIKNDDVKQEQQQGGGMNMGGMN